MTNATGWRLYKATPTGAGLWEYFVDGAQIASLMTADGCVYQAQVVRQDGRKKTLASLYVSAHSLDQAQAEVECVIRDLRYGVT